MKVALERTYAATPAPKWVVAVGDCGCGCGVFEGSYAVIGAVDEVIPVDLHIPGCPPTPTALLEGLIALMDKVSARRRGSVLRCSLGGEQLSAKKLQGFA